MGRRRSLSNEISTDPEVAQLLQCGPLPALLYTWAIPHADDWGRLSGDPVKFKLTVCPALNASISEIDEALTQIACAGLWCRYEVDGRQYIAYPRNAWFKHQSYINTSKRQDDAGSEYPAPSDWLAAEESQETPRNTNDGQETAQNPASPSLSPSPSLSLSPSPSGEEDLCPDPAGPDCDQTPPSSGAQDEGRAETAPGKGPAPTADDRPGRALRRPAERLEYSAEFEEFWRRYPRRVEKRRAFKAWKARLKEGQKAEALTAAASHYADACRSAGTEERFIKHASTFLGPDKPYEDYIRGPTTDPRSGLTRNVRKALELVEKLQREEYAHGPG